MTIPWSLASAAALVPVLLEKAMATMIAEVDRPVSLLSTAAAAKTTVTTKIIARVDRPLSS